MNFLFNQIRLSNQQPKSNNINIITFVTCWYELKSKFSSNHYLIWIKNS